jgi:hypothetical protein
MQTMTQYMGTWFLNGEWPSGKYQGFICSAAYGGGEIAKWTPFMMKTIVHDDNAKKFVHLRGHVDVLGSLLKIPLFLGSVSTIECRLEVG